LAANVGFGWVDTAAFVEARASGSGVKAAIPAALGLMVRRSPWRRRVKPDRTLMASRSARRMRRICL
jgi:hypothetical protein